MPGTAATLATTGIRRAGGPAGLLAGMVLLAAALAGLRAWEASDDGAPAPGSSLPAAAAPAPATVSVAAAPAASGTVAVPVASQVRLLRLARSPSGAPVAVLAVNGGASRRHAVGDVVAIGVRLARIDADGAWIERGTSRERLALPAGAAPLPAVPAPTAAAGLPPSRTVDGLAAPSPAVAALLDGPAMPGVVTTSPDRAHPARGGLERQVAAEAVRLAAAPAR